MLEARWSNAASPARARSQISIVAGRPMPTPPAGDTRRKADRVSEHDGEPLADPEIRDPAVVRAILASLNLPTEPLPITRARPPPDEDAFDWAA